MQRQKDFKPTQGMITAAETLFMAMAHKAAIEPVVLGYERKILKKHRWEIAEEWREKGIPPEIILDPDHTYLLSDEDFKIYNYERNEERIKAGFVVDHPDKCPLLIADHHVIQAQNALLDEMETLTGLKRRDVSLKLEIRKKCIDLSLTLLAPFVSSKKILEGIKK